MYYVIIINSYIKGSLFAKLLTKQYAIHIQLKPRLSATQIRLITRQVPGDCLLWNTEKNMEDSTGLSL